MSCSCNNSCDPEHEPLPSTVDNFVTQFFGSVTKTCVDGQVIWTLPCDLDEGIPGYPRIEGEGLACYFARVLEDISQGGGGGGGGGKLPDGNYGDVSVSNNGNTITLNNAVVETSNFASTIQPIALKNGVPIVRDTDVIFNIADGKLYRWNGSSYTAAVPVVDLTGQIVSGQIADNAILQAKLADNSISQAKLQNEIISSNKLVFGAVTSDKIADNAILQSKLADNAVSQAKLQDAIINNAKLVSGAVTSDKIAVNGVIAANINAGAVTADKILAGSVTTEKISAGAITSNEIAAGAVLADKIASNAVIAAKINAGAVTADKIAAGSVTTAKISAGAITSNEIAADTILANNIAANAVVAAKLAAGAVEADKIAANAITAGKIATNAITAGTIAAGAVNTAALAAGSVTADKMFVDSLSAITANLGTATAGIFKSGAATTFNSGNGFFLGKDVDDIYKFRVGNPSVGYISWDGSTWQVVNLPTGEGFDVKDPVKVATTGSNITLSGGAPATLDTISLSLNDRILVKDQTNPVQNGIYVVSVVGSGTNGTWVRSADADSSGDIDQNTYTFVQQGPVNASTSWVVTSPGPITIGTDPIVWTKFFAVTSISFSSIVGTIDPTQIADGSIAGTKFASGIKPIEIVSVLPSSGNFQGRVVFLTTTDGAFAANKLYRWTSSVFSTGKDYWTATVPAVDITGQISSGQIADGSIAGTKFASGLKPIEVVNSLPAAGTAGRVVFLTTDNKLYRDTGTAWTVAVPAVDITGQISSGQIADGSIAGTKFASGLKPIEVLATLPAAGTAGRVVFLTSDNQIYRDTGTAWTVAVPAVNITGQISSGQIADGSIAGTKFASGLRPIEVVATLPTVGTAGRVVFLTTDNKLYRDTGTAWTAAVPAADVTGQITTVQITNTAITTDKIATNAITAEKITANSITSDKIIANAITSDKITANAITSDKISANSITSGQIQAGAITATQIAAGAITAGKLAADSVTATNIAAGSIQADKIATNAVTTDKIAANSITTGMIQAGAISATQLAAGAVTAGKLAADSVTAVNISAGSVQADKIATNAVTSSKIAADSITTGMIQAGAVTASQIATNGVTADKIAANAITAAKIAAGAVEADKIATNSITSDKITANAITTGMIQTGAVTAAQIAAEAVTAGKLAANAVTADTIAANSITSGKIAANAVTASAILAGSVTADKMSVSSLSAITANLGVATAGIFKSSPSVTFGSGTGFFIGQDTDTVYKLRVGDPSGNYFSWNGSQINVRGTYSGGIGDSLLNASPSGTTIGSTSARYFTFNTFAAGTTELLAKSGSSTVMSLGAYSIGGGDAGALMTLSNTLGSSLTVGPGTVSFSSGGTFENGTFRANTTSVDAKDCNVRVTTAGSPVIVLNRDVGGQPEIWINGQKVVKARYTGSVTNTAEIIACLQYHGLCN
jgi:hypothetical protein